LRRSAPRAFCIWLYAYPKSRAISDSVCADFLVADAVLRNRSPAGDSLLTRKKRGKSYETRAKSGGREFKVLISRIIPLQFPRRETANVSKENSEGFAAEHRSMRGLASPQFRGLRRWPSSEPAVGFLCRRLARFASRGAAPTYHIGEPSYRAAQGG
jgi:hypothetical protein